MALKEVPQSEWATFLEDLSRQNESGLVTVEVRGDSLPQQAIFSNMPLIGIAFDSKGSGAGQIDIMVGSDTDSNSSHAVPHPALLKTEETPDGGVQTLLIDGPVGEPVTLVHFLSAT